MPPRQRFSPKGCYGDYPRSCHGCFWFPRTYYVFNAKIIANFRKQYVDAPKDDWFDCLVIADRLRFGRLPESCQVDFRYLPLQRLTRFRHHLVQTITREKNYFLSNLFFKFNTLCQDKVLSDTFGAASETILTEFLSPKRLWRDRWMN